MATITPVTGLTADSNGADSLTAIKTVVTNLNTDKLEAAAIAGKADKVGSATNGNFAGLDANGNLTDSGSKAADFAVAAKGVTNGDSHDHSGGDGAAIVEAAITLADNTTNDVSTTKHGFVPKAPNDTTKFFRGDGTWAADPGAASTASDDLWQSADTERSNNAASYVKLKEIKVYQSGVFRVKFDLRTNSDGQTAYGRVYVNGSAVGAEQTTVSTVYSTKSEDLTVAAGDLIQLYAKATLSYIAYVKNFRIYSTNSARMPVVITD